VGEALDRNDLMSFIDDQDCPAERTKSNAVGTITDTMNNSPLGAGLELGIPLSLGKTKKYLKQGWSTPDPWALLYAMYVYAERIGNHHDFTVRELVSIGRDKKNDLPAVDPITVFALNPDTVKDTFQDLANQYPQYMKVSFVAGLDNIQLDPKVTSLDILKAAVKEA
jgi:phosphoadenosine phosphosulfate reductase